MGGPRAHIRRRPCDRRARNGVPILPRLPAEAPRAAGPRVLHGAHHCVQAGLAPHPSMSTGWCVVQVSVGADSGMCGPLALGQFDGGSGLEVRASRFGPASPGPRRGLFSVRLGLIVCLFVFLFWPFLGLPWSGQVIRPSLDSPVLEPSCHDRRKGPMTERLSVWMMERP